MIHRKVQMSNLLLCLEYKDLKEIELTLIVTLLYIICVLPAEP